MNKNQRDCGLWVESYTPVWKLTKRKLEFHSKSTSERSITFVSIAFCKASLLLNNIIKIIEEKYEDQNGAVMVESGHEKFEVYFPPTFLEDAIVRYKRISKTIVWRYRIPSSQ